MNMLTGPASQGQNIRRFARIMLNDPPQARASIKGDKAHRGLHGAVYFYRTPTGVLVAAELYGLPQNGDGHPVFGFHIHEGDRCAGGGDDPFAATGGHYNPEEMPHPAHAGDLPPLFANNGYAFSVFFTDRFTIDEIVGRTVVVHAAPDDFTTQPSGNSGAKIACGVIKK